MVLGYLCSYGYVLLVLLMAVTAEKFQFLTGEGRRKMVHILLVFTWVIMCTHLQGTVHMVVIPASFVLLNYISYASAKKEEGGSIPILSSMERKGAEETPGTVYYALSIMIMSVVTLFSDKMILPCGIGLFCMAFGDGMAGVIGKRSTGIFAKQFMKDKSIGGTIACILFSIIGCEILLMLSGAAPMLLQVTVIGILCAVLELPGDGLDNLTFGCMMAAALLL